MLQVVPPQSPFDVTLLADPASGAARLCLRGDFDMTGAAAFLAAVDAIDATAREIVIDLRAVEFLDLHGLRAILEARRQAPAPLRLIVGGSPARRLFELTDLVHLIDGGGPDAAPARGALPPRPLLVAAEPRRVGLHVVLAEAG